MIWVARSSKLHRNYYREKKHREYGFTPYLTGNMDKETFSLKFDMDEIFPLFFTQKEVCVGDMRFVFATLQADIFSV